MARVWRVAAPAPVGIAAHVAVRVPDVVAVLLVELLVCHEPEAVAPEAQRFVEGEPDALEKERVLQTAKVLEVRAGVEGVLEVRHAEWEVLGGERGDVVGGRCWDCGAGVGVERGWVHGVVGTGRGDEGV